MRKLLSILFIGIILVGCSGSKGCGCPSWGMNDLDESKIQVLQAQVTEDGWVWN